MKKVIPPIIVTLLVGLIIFAYAYGVLTSLRFGGIPEWVIILVSVLFISLLAALIYTLYKRISEIKEENDDDISKY